MDYYELKNNFTDEFFEEFQYDAEFRSIFVYLKKGLTPYEAIEHLCKSKKEIISGFEKVVENAPQRIILSPERFDKIVSDQQTKET